MIEVDFFFDFISPYSYLAQTQLRESVFWQRPAEILGGQNYNST